MQALRTPHLRAGSYSYSSQFEVLVDNLGFKASVAVRNLGYGKIVGVMYTTDNWATTRTVNGTYSYTASSDTEVWSIDMPVGSASNVKYAVFYKVNGQSYWDSNFGRNFCHARTLSFRAALGQL